MKGDPEQRAVLLGEYIARYGATVRRAASAGRCRHPPQIPPLNKGAAASVGAAAPYFYSAERNWFKAPFSSRDTCA